MTPQPAARRHLRDAAKVCAATMKLSSGLVISRCERDAGHDGQHKDGCTHWGPSAEARP